MIVEHEQVWWIVPAGQRQRHAITDRPGARPAGDTVRALCTASVKLPYETWPTSKEPASLSISDRCEGCETVVTEHQQRGGELVISTWDS